MTHRGLREVTVGVLAVVAMALIVLTVVLESANVPSPRSDAPAATEGVAGSG